MSHCINNRGILAVATGMLVALGGGCSSNKTDVEKGSANIGVSLPQALQIDIASMVLTVKPGPTPPSFNDMVVAMSKHANGDWTAYVAGIPAGAGRVFHVEACDVAGPCDSTVPAANHLYSGEATATITAGTTAQVFMMLQQPGSPNQWNNHAPVIDSLTASANLVIPGTNVSLAIVAHDPDTAGDPNNHISGYQWAVSQGCGTLANATTPTPTWTAPGSDATCTISVTVSDVCPPSQPQVCSSSVTASLVIEVKTSQTGNANVTAYPNTCPAISCVSGTETFHYSDAGVVDGYEADLTVTAVDPEADDLHYVWSSDCATAVFTPDGHNPTGEIQNAPTTVHFSIMGDAAKSSDCNVRVDVKDYWAGNTPPAGSGLPAARGCNNGNGATGMLTLSHASDFHYNPVIENPSGPNANNQVSEGQKVVFTASVSDPQNDYPLTVQWLGTGGGTFGTQVLYGATDSGKKTVSTEWTAPATIAGAMSVTLRVTNPTWHLSTDYVFNIVPANTCALAADGTPCNDGNACTGASGAVDHCQAGQCVGGAATVCNGSPGQCYAAAGTCNPANGQCSYTASAVGTSCDLDGNGCTAGDSCNGSGTCMAGPAPVCNAPPNSSCYAASGTCVSGGAGSYTCDYTPAAAGSTCTPSGSFDHCLTTYTCDATHACVGSSPVSCAGGSQCSSGGTCDSADGVCKGGTNYPVTQTCNDSLGCTTGDHCNGNGACVAGAPLCVAPQTCVEPGTCSAPADPQATLVTAIDPNVMDVRNVATDLTGGVYVAGQVFGAAVVGGTSLPTPLGVDVVIAKLDPTTYNAVWVHTFGDPAGTAPTSAQTQSAHGVTVTSTGTVAFMGSYQGTMTIGNALPIAGTQYEFTAALSSTGTPMWSHGYNLGGASFYTIAGSLEQDALVICGTSVIAATDLVPSAIFCSANPTDPACGPCTGTNATSQACTTAANTDVVVAKLNPANGNVLWSKQYPGVGSQYCTGLTIDHAGDVIMAGEYNGHLDLAPGGTSSPFPFIGSTGRSQFYIAKLRASDGQTIAAISFNNGLTGTPGGLGNQNITSATTDANGDVIIGGTIQRSVYFSPSIIITALGTTADAFVAKLDGTTLAPLWVRRWGSATIDSTNGVAVDSLGQVYATGSFTGTADVGPGTATITSNGAADVFLVRLDGATGATTSAKGYGDNLTQNPLGISVNRFATNSEKDVIQLEGVVYQVLDFGNGQVLNTGSSLVFEVFLARMK